MDCKLFDTHTHFNFNAYKDDWEKTIKRTLDKNIWFVNVGAEAKTSKRAVEIAKKYPEGVYATVGLHPIHTYDDKLEEIVNGEKVEFITKAEEFDKLFYANLIKSSNKVVAIGETGLDYFHIRKFPTKLNKKLKAKQAEIFIDQIKLAVGYNKPNIIHCRPDKNFDAYREILEILKSNNTTGIIHCFQANLKILEEFLKLGFYIGFNGVVTFTDQYNKLIAATPLDKIVLETDSPWLTPVPYRGQRNESVHVEYVAKHIAKIKNIDYEDIANATTKNAKRIFQISNGQ